MSSRPNSTRGAEERVHGALRVGRHQDEAARRARAPPLQRRRLVAHAHRAQIVREDLAQLVVADLADIGALAAERGEAGDRVRRPSRRTSRCRGPMQRIERLGARRVDQRHGALDQALRSRGTPRRPAASTSTMALPMPTTSSVGATIGGFRVRLRGKRAGSIENFSTAASGRATKLFICRRASGYLSCQCMVPMPLPFNFRCSVHVHPQET